MASLLAGTPPIVAGLRPVRLVGRGGEGEVWEARDARGRRRALKLIRPEALAAPGAVEQRGAYLQRIDHPALVRVHRSGVLGDGRLAGFGFVEMDFVDGASLHEAPATRRLLDRLEPLAEALDLLHVGAWSGGVALVHRDVKPANIVEDPDGRLVLVDPSTLRGVDATHLTRVGTPVFSAPEVESGRVGPAADVYSFAVTVLALITGARGSALADLVDAADSLDLPESLRLALSPRPGDRPVSCRAVLEGADRISPEMAASLSRHVDGADGEENAAGHEVADVDEDTVVRAEPWDAGDATRHEAEAARTEWLPALSVPAPPPDTARLPDGASDGWAPDARDAGWSRAGPVTTAPVPPVPAPPPDRPRAAWPWVLALAVVIAGPLVAWMQAVPLDRVASTVAIAGVVHVVAHLVARRSLGLALLLPPVAWAFLLADRVSGPGALRRGWARAMTTGALGLVTVPPVAVVTGLAGDALGRPEAAALSLTGVGLAALATTAVTATGAGGAVLRLLLAPLWMAGALLLVAGGTLLFPLALMAGRARAVGGLVVGTLGGVTEVFRPPRAAPAPRDPGEPVGWPAW